MGTFSDQYFKKEVCRLIDKYNIKTVVETGTYEGQSSIEFSKLVDNVHTFEINKRYHDESAELLKDYPNVTQYLGNSAELLCNVIPKIDDEYVLYFLDAHWYNYCPLLDEIRAIAKYGKNKSIIIIHDFKVPGKDFGYDDYNGQAFEWSWVEPEIKKVYGDKFKYYYNTEADGVYRGVLYVEPYD
jgi:predicted O-methyltransferase YrrM